MKQYFQVYLNGLLVLWLTLFATQVWSQMDETAYERQLLITLNNPVTAGLSGAGSTWKGWNFGGGYRTSAPISFRVSALADDFNLTLVDEWPISLIDVHCIVVSVPDDVNIDSTIESLTDHPFVESVQFMQLFATQSLKYNDPLLDLQKNVSDMHVLPVHQWSQGKGVKVGVIDTGINVDHPDLQGQIARTHDFVKHQGDAFNDDEHGTAIAGIIAAIADNSEGIVGVAPQTQLYSYKACWPRDEKNTGAVCSSFTLAQALSSAIDEGMDILNLSLAGPMDPLLSRIVTAGIEKGITVVGAVGQDREIDQQFPAAVPGVIAVEESSIADKHHRLEHVSIFTAPGDDVLTTTAAGKYNYQSGSSLSTAHVTGVAALLKAVQPRLRPSQIMVLLDVNRSDLIEDEGGLPISNNRIAEVNACQALNSLMRSDICQ